MSRNREILQEFRDNYESAYYAWNPYYPLGARDLDMWLGNQWNPQERQKLYQDGRNAWCFNRIRPNINMVTGYQRKNRLSSVVVPLENSDQETADQLSQLLLYVMQSADGYRILSDCFTGAAKTGWNLCTVWMDYRDDPINGDIKLGREPYSGFITDPYFTNLDFSDCSYIIRRKYVSPQLAASLLPGYEKDVYQLHELGWSRDDMFTWLPYQQQPNGQDFIAFNEFFQQKWRNVPLLVDMKNGEILDFEGTKEQARIISGIHPDLKLITRPERYIERHIILNDEFIKTDENPYGLDEYPFAAMAAQFDPESDDWSLKVQSLVRCMVDPQKESNRRRSQMTDIVDSQINSGYIAEEDSVINPRSLFQTSQGKVIWKKRGTLPGAIEKIPPAQIPPSMFQLQELFDRDMTEILGINPAAMGLIESGNESGVMMMLRQSAAIVNLQDTFDNMRSCQKQISKKIVKLIQTWSPEKVKRILNQEPTQQFYDKEFTKYDISVQEGMLTDTQKQIYFRQLIDIKQITDVPSNGPITAKMIVDAAPIQGKTTLIKEVAANEKAAAAANQQQQQVQQSLIDSQRQMAQATALADIALSKERVTRAVANMAQQDERAAKAVQDRADASLSQVKAAKELEGIDQDQLIKALQIVKMLQQANSTQEESIKEDDIALSATADSSVHLPALEQPQGQQMQQQMMPEQLNPGVPNG